MVVASDIARDTIFALSSGRPPAAIAVVRISGPRAHTALETLAGRVPEPRKAALVRVRDPGNDEVIDEALALWFPGPNSETGEDIAELQLHGGRAVIAAVFGALGRLDGLRPAEAGEFTRRAFENGRLDLTAVEARIDFSDEADVPEDLIGPALGIARALCDEIGEALAGAAHGERLRDGLTVAIAGPPNAGKSTLLNRIARREVAIVSPHAGTTRDVIEVHLDLHGYPVTLLDTAGIRDSEDPVEQEGVRRARERASAADLVVWVEDARKAVEDARKTAEHSVPQLGSATTWLVFNKVDLVKPNEEMNRNTESKTSTIIYYISAFTGQGLNDFISALAKFAEEFFGREPALISRERHRSALQATLAALERALAEGAEGREDIVAEELRLAAGQLGRLIGRVDVEDILDVIFRDFCIGK
jgi:tRNA modification GTPase